MNCTLYLRDREKGKSVPRTTWHQGVESDQNSTLFFCLLKYVPWQVVSIFSANSTVRQEIGLLRDPQFLLDYITTQEMLEVLLLFVCFSANFKHPETHQQVQIRTRAHFKTNQQLRWEKCFAQLSAGANFESIINRKEGQFFIQRQQFSLKLLYVVEIRKEVFSQNENYYRNTDLHYTPCICDEISFTVNNNDTKQQ